MIDKVTLSQKTKKILATIETLEKLSFCIHDALKNASVIDKNSLLNWLMSEQNVTNAQQFYLQSLQVALLKDLYHSLFEKREKSKEEKANWLAKLKFILLAIAGSIFVACEGFDGITAIFSITSLSTIPIFIIGIVFSIFSVIVFYSFDLQDISKTLGVNLKDSPKIIDLYLQELEMTKRLRKEIDRNFFKKKNVQELDFDINLLLMLKERHFALDDARHSLKKSLNNPFLKIAKVIAALVAGIIFFSGGFFAGQTVALSIASLFLASVSVSFWPVIVAGILVGTAAFSLYWFVERPNIENLIGRWVGLDKVKIDELCDDEAVEKEQNKLSLLIDKLEARTIEINQLYEFETKNRESHSPSSKQDMSIVLPKSFENSTTKSVTTTRLTRSLSLGSFFKPSSNEDDMSLENKDGNRCMPL